MSGTEYKSHIYALMEQIEDQSILADISSYIERITGNSITEEIQLTQEQKDAIDEGLKSIKESGTSSREEVKTRMKAKYPDLYS